ncbi:MULTISPECIES: dihydrofolate reductase family protein [Salinibaculum]|uniref:dihydrofolate reductase family protein n=1 Tax=Salinibaculum TaxID=2732368 RepID=UPI0030CAC2A0
MSPGRVTLYIAASLDGFIADEDGGVGWLDEYQQTAESGETGEAYAAFFESVDCLVVGSKTYEQIRGFGEWPYGDRPTYVLTHRDLPRAAETVEFRDGDVQSVATELKEQYGHVWLVGGAALAGSFLREGQIDEIRLSLIPVLLGGGVSLFPATDETQALELRDAVARDDGIVELRYRVHN